MIQLLGAFTADPKEFFLSPLTTMLGYPITISDLILLFSFITGSHYNLENIYYGFKGAESKLKGFLVLSPYLLVFLMTYLSIYSQFF